MTKKEEEIKWQKLLSCKRLSKMNKPEKSVPGAGEDPRNPFEKDSDRIIYSYPFRRLQDKTQVIPLPVLDFVHTRLTHSLEVSTVGRSLGRRIENFLVKRAVINSKVCGSISAIVSAACLAHDIGNPPFGHSGENSISEYFKFSKGNDYLNQKYAKLLDPKNPDAGYCFSNQESEIKMRDLRMFEGNAMGG